MINETLFVHEIKKMCIIITVFWSWVGDGAKTFRVTAGCCGVWGDGAAKLNGNDCCCVAWRPFRIGDCCTCGGDDAAAVKNCWKAFEGISVCCWNWAGKANGNCCCWACAAAAWIAFWMDCCCAGVVVVGVGVVAVTALDCGWIWGGDCTTILIGCTWGGGAAVVDNRWVCSSETFVKINNCLARNL